jgi:hypothetical protein
MKGGKNMLDPKIKIYEDMDENGSSFTVYVDGECVLTSALSDDIDLKKYLKGAHTSYLGLDNRSI